MIMRIGQRRHYERPPGRGRRLAGIFHSCDDAVFPANATVPLRAERLADRVGGVKLS